MRLIGRNDLFLLAGLTVALFTIMSRPLGRVLDVAREIDEEWGLQLMPGLVILAVVFVVHQIRKRHESRAEARAAAAEARQATARAAELERLVGFSQALGLALTHDAIGEATAAHLPTVAEGRGAWVMVWSRGEWKRLAAHGDVPMAACEEAARRAVSGAAAGSGGDAVCFPMFAAGKPVGVLGVLPNPPIPEHQRAVLAAAAALLGVSLKNAELFDEVRESSVRDSLTGCLNRRHTIEIMTAELHRARRSRLPLALLMFDLDRFKAINDQYGHLCGDAVLASVGQRMQSALRSSDVKCRWGGEEFLVLLPETPLAGAERVAELIRSDFEAHPVRWRAGDRDVVLPVTASFGLTMVSAGELDAAAIIARADAALYRAKSDGRNRVVAADQEVGQTARATRT
jgi:diguanylate cyclase (GGDEF)-like protein